MKIYLNKYKNLKIINLEEPNNFETTIVKKENEIVFFSDEWQNRKIQCENFVRSTLQLNKIKIHGRLCQVFEIPLPIARSFLNDYHIQGANKLTDLIRV